MIAGYKSDVERRVSVLKFTILLKLRIVKAIQRHRRRLRLWLKISSRKNFDESAECMASIFEGQQFSSELN